MYIEHPEAIHISCLTLNSDAAVHITALLLYPMFWIVQNRVILFFPIMFFIFSGCSATPCTEHKSTQSEMFLDLLSLPSSTFLLFQLCQRSLNQSGQVMWEASLQNCPMLQNLTLPYGQLFAFDPPGSHVLTCGLSGGYIYQVLTVVCLHFAVSLYIINTLSC
jgi:hypothetical protein